MVRSRCTPYSRGRPRLGRWHTFPRAGWCLRPSVCSVEWAVMVVNVAMGGCVVLCSSGTETESNVLPCAPPITSRGVCWREHVVGTSRWAAFVVFLDCNCFVSAVVRRLSPGLQEDLYGAEPYALNLLPAGGRHWGGGAQTAHTIRVPANGHLLHLFLPSRPKALVYWIVVSLVGRHYCICFAIELPRTNTTLHR